MVNNMEKIKKILFKTINIKNTYLLGIIVVSLILVVLLFSYAIFTASVEQRGVLNIVAGNLYAIVDSETVEISSVIDEENNIFSLPPGHQIVVDLKLQNVNSVPVTMKPYWKLTSGYDDGLHYVGVIEENDSSSVATNGVTLDAYGNEGATKTVKVLIDNVDSTSGGNFQIGAVVGLQGYDLSIPEDAKSLISYHYTPESCFEFDSSTGTITKYLCGPKVILTGTTIQDNTSLPSGVSSVISDVIIPPAIGDVEVKKVISNMGPYGGFSSTKITSAVLPDTLTEVGTWAFADTSTSALGNIHIPNSVTSIGDYAFMYTVLKYLTIPSSVATIGSNAFTYSSLINLSLSEGLVTIGGAAFAGNNLTTLTIPESVKTINSGAFGANKLTSVTIKGKSSSADFTNYPPTTPFGWAEGYSDANITWNG